MKALTLVFLFLFAVSSFAASKKEDEKNEQAIKAVNAAVEELDSRISSEDKKLPVVRVEYDYHGPKETVPSSLKYYFEGKKAGLKEKPQLRVFKSHADKETYTVDRSYYFDEKGKPLKYQETNSKFSGDAAQMTIIYDKYGSKVYSSPNAKVGLDFDEVKDTFNSLDKGLEKAQ